MYIQTQTKYQQFQGDELTDLLSQMSFKINTFGLWQSPKDVKASYLSNDIEIVYYQKGGSRTVIGEKEYDCPEKSFLILEPFKLNTSKNENHDRYAFYYFHFEIEPIALQHQLLSLLTRHGNVIYANEVKDFSEMLDRLLVESTEQEIGYSSIITSALIRVVVEIIRAQLKRGKQQEIKIIRSPYVQLVNEAMMYIQEHLYEPIRLPSLTRFLGVSVSELYKAFMKVLDDPPATYIQRQKIKYAQRKFAEGSSVTRIAQELGYSSAYHLSKVFKQMTGVSPKEYKKKINL